MYCSVALPAIKLELVGGGGGGGGVTLFAMLKWGLKGDKIIIIILLLLLLLLLLLFFFFGGGRGRGDHGISKQNKNLSLF